MTVAKETIRRGTTPTERELVVLRAWVEEGSASRAAIGLGITTSGVESMLANVRARAGVSRTWQAARLYLG